MSQGLSYIRILTRNFEEMFHFYSETIGLQLKFGEPSGPYCEFETGSTDIALFEKEKMEEVLGIDINDQQFNANVIIIFPVVNVDKFYEELKDKGIEFLTEPVTREGWDVRTAHLRDPDGNLIEINTRIELLNEGNMEGVYL